VQVQKLATTEGFIAFDLDDAPAVGIVRLAPKVLVPGAELLARSTTYAAASFGLNVGGGSAGLNAVPDARDATVAAFVEEVGPLVESGRWLVGAGLGTTEADLASLPRSDERAKAFDATLQAAGALAAARAMADGAAVAVVGGEPVAEAAAQEAGVETGSPFDAPADVLLVAGKAGVIDHDVAPLVKARVVVPLTPVPLTARALALLGRADVVVIPDFVSTAAPLLAAVDADGGDPVERVAAKITELRSEGTGCWLAAANQAEEHLRTWRDDLPFGRPLA
jgi:glutamate dehydrogenase/leucine dehydrogenase